MSTDYDAVVLGGGPSSTAATTANRNRNEKQPDAPITVLLASGPISLDLPVQRAGRNPGDRSV